jgi:iron complex transport system ATP-binding protein
VTHHVSDIVPEVTRVVTIRDGHVMHDGAKTDLLADGPMAELFGIPARLEERDGWYRMW